jgi:hypothetical protein
MTHRDPVIAFASTCSVVESAQRSLVPGHRRDPVELGHFVLEHMVEATRGIMAARDALGDRRFYDVYQRDVETRPIETVERIYEFLNLDLADNVRLEMETWTAENRPGSRGQHQYAAEQFGFTTETVQQAFADYLEYCSSPSS